MPAALQNHARHGPADPQRLHAGAGTGPIDLRPAVRPHRPAAGAAGRRAAVCRRVAGAGRRRQRRALRRVAAATALGASAALVAMFATVRDVYADRPEGSTIYGLFSAMLAFVPALGPMLGAAIAAGFGWRAIFVALGAAGLLAWLRAMPRWRETRPSTPGARRPASRPCWAACGSGSIRWDSARRWAPSSCSSRPRRACSWAPPATRTYGLQRGLLDGRAGHDRGHAAGARLVARWGIAGSFARGAATMLAGAALLAGCAATTAPSLPPS